MENKKEKASKASIKSLLHQLNKGDNFSRYEAAKALGVIGSSEATKALIEVLETDQYYFVREKAAEALGVIGSLEAIPSLKKASKYDPDPGVREAAAQALANSPYWPGSIIFSSLNNSRQLLSFVTLGAKIYPGQGREKHCFQPTVDSQALASQIKARLIKAGEIQISVGFDTGFNKYQHRAKFIALALFIISVNLDHFTTFKDVPKRDHGASYGLVIRGAEVKALNEINIARHRIDYLFHVSPEISQGNLAQLIYFLQYLNLGLLLTTAYWKYPQPERSSLNVTPVHSTIISLYENFEAELVQILRKFNSLLNPEAIYEIPGQEKYNLARKESLKYLLEECLYPDKEWLNDLYAIDNSWSRLLPYLRKIEAVILQREADEGNVPLGNKFIREVQRLVVDKATDIRLVLEGKKICSEFLPPDQEREPFIDYKNFPDQSVEYQKRYQQKKEEENA